MVLSAILNLGNIQFEVASNDDDCFIKVETRMFLNNAAVLLKISEFELEDAITMHTRIVGNQQIK